MLLTDLNANQVEFGEIIVDAERAQFKAAAKTDWFFPPDGSTRLTNVPYLGLLVAEPVFHFSAKVEVSFKSPYDGAALFVRTHDDQWGKIAFEYSPQANPTIVSVVTRGTSDDSDGPQPSTNTVFLRAYRHHSTFAFHFSEDGKYWKFLRWFSLSQNEPREVELGIGCQSPTGAGCSAVVSDFRYVASAIPDLRNGH